MIELELKVDGMTNRKFFAAHGEDIEFICKKCDKPVSEGFVCENNKALVLCQKCQDKFDMMRCEHDKWGQHQHTKFQRAQEMSHTK